MPIALLGPSVPLGLDWELQEGRARAGCLHSSTGDSVLAQRSYSAKEVNRKEWMSECWRELCVPHWQGAVGSGERRGCELHGQVAEHQG